MSLGTIVITGAAGRIGTVLRERLGPDAKRLVLVDRVPMTAGSAVEDVRQSELSSAEEAAELVAGADGIVHLAGIPDEAPYEDLLKSNVLSTCHILEGARRASVQRVVLASSNRTTGSYPVSQRVTPELPPRPDGLYGASKVAAEAYGRVYADKFGIEFVSLRIGSFEPEPSEPRRLATWLSYRDCAGFVRAALTAPVPGFTVSYAVSANKRRFWEVNPVLGYEPVDDAEAHAERFPDADAFFTAGGAQSGRMADPEFTLPHLG